MGIQYGREGGGGGVGGGARGCGGRGSTAGKGGIQYDREGGVAVGVQRGGGTAVRGIQQEKLEYSTVQWQLGGGGFFLVEVHIDSCEG